MNQQLLDWAKEALEMLNDNHHLVADNEKHAYVMMHLEVIERGKALLEQQKPSVTVRYDLSAADTEAAIRDKLIELGWTPPAQPAPVQEHELALYEATQIATWLWKNFYKDTAPQWEVLPDIRGVLSQIDNMVAGLKYDPPAQPADHSEQHLNMVDHDVEKAVAYLNGVHTGKQLAKRVWVGLTEEELKNMWDMHSDVCGEIAMHDRHAIAYAIEAKLREKNGGGA